MNPTHEFVREQIFQMNEAIVSWIAGTSPSDDATFQASFTRRMSDGLTVIMPGGMTFHADAFAEFMRKNHGKNPRFRIQIRDVTVRHRGGDLLVVTYTEWQRNAVQSTPGDNGRICTAVVRLRDSDLELLHVHETWLPEEIVRADPFEF
jgi:hypothetical protein